MKEQPPQDIDKPVLSGAENVAKSIGSRACALFDRRPGYEAHAEMTWAYERSLEQEELAKQYLKDGNETRADEHQAASDSELAKAAQIVFQEIYGNKLLARGLPDVIFATVSCIPSIAKALAQGETPDHAGKRNESMMRVFGMLFDPDSNKFDRGIATMRHIGAHISADPNDMKFVFDTILVSDYKLRQRSHIPEVDEMEQTIAIKQWSRIAKAMGVDTFDSARTIDEIEHDFDAYYLEHAKPTAEGKRVTGALQEDFANIFGASGTYAHAIGKDAFAALLPGPESDNDVRRDSAREMLGVAEPRKVTAWLVRTAYALYAATANIRPMKRYPWSEIGNTTKPPRTQPMHDVL